MKKLIILVNSPLFVKQHISSILENHNSSTKIFLITSYDKQYQIKIPNVVYIPIKINRSPSLKDLISLISFIYLRLIIKADLSLSFTPKAGFLNALTFFLPGKTIHYFTGQRWVTFKGLNKYFYMMIDKFIIKVSNQVYCDSFSQAKFIAKKLNTKTPKVINHGSLSGVDTNLFTSKIRKRTFFKNELQEINRYSLFKNFLNKCPPNNSISIFGYIGRLHIDKGIITLLETFKEHLKTYPNNKLVLIGPIELNKKHMEIIYNNQDSFIHLDYTNYIYYYYPHFRGIILPSLREGFGSVVIEAGACKVPCICTKVSGPIDIIKHNINGYFIKKKSRTDLLNAINYFANNPNKVKLLGENAYKLVREKYEKKYVEKNFYKEFDLL